MPPAPPSGEGVGEPEAEQEELLLLAGETHGDHEGALCVRDHAARARAPPCLLLTNSCSARTHRS